MSDLVDRFHRVLVQEIRKNRPEYLESRFTVAEIYQNLVPYRTHRDAIGVEMNGDYEDTLLRLLAGEGDYLMIESEVARREIREELQSSNPNTGLFRDFAAADVRLTSAHEDVEDDGASEHPDATDQVDVEAAPETADLADLLAAADEDPDDLTGVVELDLDGSVEHSDSNEESEGEEAADEVEEEEVMTDESEDDIGEEDTTGEGATSASGSGDAEACQWCRADLPERSVLNYCPFCGSDLKITPCGQCGEELEPGWRFCAGCGTEVGA